MENTSTITFPDTENRPEIDPANVSVCSPFACISESLGGANQCGGPNNFTRATSPEQLHLNNFTYNFTRTTPSERLHYQLHAYSCTSLFLLLVARCGDWQQIRGIPDLWPKLRRTSNWLGIIANTGNHPPETPSAQTPNHHSDLHSLVLHNFTRSCPPLNCVAFIFRSALM